MAMAMSRACFVTLSLAATRLPPAFGFRAAASPLQAGRLARQRRGPGRAMAMVAEVISLGVHNHDHDFRHSLQLSSTGLGSPPKGITPES